MLQVFDYYESLGVLEVTLTSLPDTQPNDPVLTNMLMYQARDPHVQLWRNEPISVNDCFLKNMNMYRYIVNIDNDEVIVPDNKTGATWVEMMEVVENITKNEACSGESKNVDQFISLLMFSRSELGDLGTLSS